jgi:hypothetical protein
VLPFLTAEAKPAPTAKPASAHLRLSRLVSALARKTNRIHGACVTRTRA